MFNETAIIRTRLLRCYNSSKLWYDN